VVLFWYFRQNLSEAKQAFIIFGFELVPLFYDIQVNQKTPKILILVFNVTKIYVNGSTPLVSARL
jgi:hypothetical protein